jgi:hypothetical protein
MLSLPPVDSLLRSSIRLQASGRVPVRGSGRFFFRNRIRLAIGANQNEVFRMKVETGVVRR